MNLFDSVIDNEEEKLPLAARMRPKKLEDIVGQGHIIGKDKLLYRLIKADRIQSMCDCAGQIF